MSNTIVNTWANRGFKITTGTWNWHKQHGYLGGEDYVVGANVAALACAEGEAYIVNDGLNSVEIIMENGYVITQRELKSRHGNFPRHVNINDQIGTTGNIRAGIQRWPHIDITIKGIRKQFTKYVTKTNTASIGPVKTLEEIIMALPANGKGVVYDKKYREGWFIDMTNRNGDGCVFLSNSKSTRWKIATIGGVKKLELETTDIQALINWLGNAPIPAGTAQPTGLVLKTTN